MSDVTTIARPPDRVRFQYGLTLAPRTHKIEFEGVVERVAMGLGSSHTFHILPLDPATSEASSLDSRVLDLVTRSPGIDAEGIATQLGVSLQDAIDAVCRLNERGVVGPA